MKMLRLASGTLTAAYSTITGRNRSRSVPSNSATVRAGDVPVVLRLTGGEVSCAARGDTLAGVLPKPKNVHQSNTIATRPNTAATINLFRSPGFRISLNCLLLL